MRIGTMHFSRLVPCAPGYIPAAAVLASLLLVGCGPEQTPRLREVDAGWTTPLVPRAAVPVGEYDVEVGVGGLLARNAAHKFDIEFGSGVHVRIGGEDSPHWVTLTLSGYGCGGDIRPVSRAIPTSTRNRVEYAHKGGFVGELVEWYVNEPKGLEQGFTLPSAPACAAQGTESQVGVEVRVGGDLVPRLSEDGLSVALRSRDRVTRARYRDLLVVDSAGRFLQAKLVVDGDLLSIWFDDREAKYPVMVDPLLVLEQFKLVAPDGVAGDVFGQSVAISGSTAVIGSKSSDNGQMNGSAYVFVENGGAWSQQAKLQPASGATGSLGYSVDIKGDTVVAGAPDDPDNGQSAGAVFVFERSGATWTQQAKILANDAMPNDVLGGSVSLSGDSLLVAAVGDEDNGPLSGSAYVFVRNGGVWSQQAKLLPSDGAAGDAFGGSVALAGDTAIVGAPGHLEWSTWGAVYVFVRSGGTWTQQAKLLVNDGLQLGWAVALSGDTVLAGATVTESAHVFARNGGQWTQHATLVSKPGENFGFSVALSGDTALVGAQRNSDGGTWAGAAYQYVRAGGSWLETAKLRASDAQQQDYLGNDVAIDDDIAIVAAPGDDAPQGDQGSAYVFALQRPNGGPCASAAECVSGFCADGVCCVNERWDPPETEQPGRGSRSGWMM